MNLRSWLSPVFHVMIGLNLGAAVNSAINGDYFTATIAGFLGLSGLAVRIWKRKTWYG